MDYLTTLGNGTADFYVRLGLQRLINAEDTITAHGGSGLSDPVLKAMAQAAAHAVDVSDLLVAAGARIAALTRNPAALVVAGAAAGVAVATAASLAGTQYGHAWDPDAADDLDVVLLCSQHNPYVGAIRASGARIRQVGFADSTPLHRLEEAIGPRTRALIWFAGTQFERYSPPLETMADVAHRHDLPLIVDAAAQLPPYSNLWRYRERGADLVIFSGGKGLRGPQASGLIVGATDWVQACARNAFPHHSVGRAMKTSKENIAGLLAAVEVAMARDEDADYRHWMSELEHAQARLAKVPGLRAAVVPTGRLGQHCPRLELRLAAHGPSPAQVAQRLRDQQPTIRVVVGETGPDTIHINPFSLADGEAAYVADRIAEALDELADMAATRGDER